MEAEIIERLAVDYAAGQLESDVRILFESYLSQNPQAEKSARQFIDIYKLTEQAFDNRIKQQLKPALEKASAIKTKCRKLFVFKWAAVIIFILSIGVGLGRLSERPSVITEKILVPVAASARAKGLLSSDSASSLWQRKVEALKQTKLKYPIPASTGGFDILKEYRENLRGNNYE